MIQHHEIEASFHASLRPAAATTLESLQAATEKVHRRPGVDDIDRRGTFTEHWTNHLRELCEIAYGDDREQVRSVLEIGAWEGRSTIFFATFFPNARITTIDTFQGSDGYPAGRSPSPEELFDRNTAVFGDRIAKCKGLSSQELPRLHEAGRRFDLAFVDGSHFADDIWVDTYYSWAMLSVGGVLIWDDYLWDEYANSLANPRAAVDRFLDVHAGEFEPLFAEWLVAVRRTPHDVSRTLRGSAASAAGAPHASSPQARHPLHRLMAKLGFRPDDAQDHR